MRIKIMIPLMFVFAFLVLNAYSILEPSEVSTGAGESLADKLLNASQGGGVLTLTNPKYTASPQQSQALHEKNLNWSPSLGWEPNPESLSIHTTPQAGRTEAENQVIERSADTAVARSSVGPQNPTPSSANLAGTWSLDMNDTSLKQSELTLFQVEDKIFGAGNIRDKSNILMVAASGSVRDGQIYLDITSVGTISLYSLVMTSKGERRDLVSGDYKAYTPNGRTWMGKVQGRRSVPSSKCLLDASHSFQFSLEGVSLPSFQMRSKMSL